MAHLHVDQTTEIVKLLESAYGEPHPQDLHIEYFFLLLGKEIVGRRAEIIAKLNEVDGIQVPVWVSLEAKWQELLFRKAKVFKNLPTETERHREERLNEVIRKPLLALLADPHNPPHIIVSRACKYNKEVVKHRLSTPEIISNEHLDYFYLMIKQRISPEVTLPSSFILAPHIPGDWRVVEPEDTWPHTFIGYFPKKPFETEREREWRLNHEVRLAFKKKLGGLLSQKNQGIPDPETFFSILFTRACKYTN